MNITELLQRITFYTSLDNDIFPNTERLLAINNWADRLHSIIMESQDEWDFDDSNKTDLPISTRDLDENVGSYSLPPTIYKFNRLDINYGSGYIKAMPLDLNQTNLTDEEINSRVNVSQPLYRISGGIIKIFPTPTQTQLEGLRVYYDRAIDKFTEDDISTGTKEPGFDRLWHDYIALGASLDAGVKFNLINKADLKNLMDDMEIRIRKYYGSKTRDRQLGFKSLIEDYE